MAINELRSISIFVKAAELGSLRKTAAALDISPQAASQALAQLEHHLDVRLFHRTTRSMSLTDEGRRLLEEAQPSLLGLQRALRTAKQAKEEIAGPLRIVGPRSTFQPVLWRLLEEFCQQYPGIVPDVQLEDRVGNWVEDRVDVGFPARLVTARGGHCTTAVPGATDHLRFARLSRKAWQTRQRDGVAVAPLQRVPEPRNRQGRPVACQGR